MSQYFSKLATVQNYIKGAPNHIEIVNVGSTYARYAFESYKDFDILGYNLALEHQSLEYDRIILENYKHHFAPNCIIMIPLGVCVMLYKENGSTDEQYYFVLNKESISRFSQMKNLKCKCVKICKGLSGKRDIYTSFPSVVTEQQADGFMKELTEVWKELFELPDLKLASLSSQNLQNIMDNTRELMNIIEFCIKEGFRPMVVIPPFSEKLNQFFSDDFINFCLMDNINQANRRHIPCLDYRKHIFFQEQWDMFVDGGFRLNKMGSKCFMNILFNDLEKMELIKKKEKNLKYNG